MQCWKTDRRDRDIYAERKRWRETTVHSGRVRKNEEREIERERAIEKERKRESERERER